MALGLTVAGGKLDLYCVGRLPSRSGVLPVVQYPRRLSYRVLAVALAVGSGLTLLFAGGEPPNPFPELWFGEPFGHEYTPPSNRGHARSTG